MPTRGTFVGIYDGHGGPEWRAVDLDRELAELEPKRYASFAEEAMLCPGVASVERRRRRRSGVQRRRCIHMVESGEG